MSTSNVLLIPTADWTFPQLQLIHDACAEIAHNELGLDTYPNQLEVITAEQMLDAYSSVGMPLYYKHWSFGKQFVNQEARYRKGIQGLAYEIVINSSPCKSYLMEENTALMQTLVIAHAAFGHNHFFKNNYLFKQWTDAEGISDYLEFAKKYVAECEEKYGAEAVEKTLDAAHALMSHGVDRYPKRKRDFKEEQARAKSRKAYVEATFNDLWRTLPETQKVTEPELALKLRQKKLELPEENILRFLEKSAPRLHPWQRELLRIVRMIAQYFYPQGQTKVMNEGCATYVHYRILTRLHEKGLISDGNWLEFLTSHTNVVYQADFDDKHFSGFNPYALGFAMMKDIERIATGLDDFGVAITDEQKAEDHDWFKDQEWYRTYAGSGDSMGALRDAWANYRDESFIMQYLSPLIMRKFRMFHLQDNPEKREGIEIKKIHDARGYKEVRAALAKQYEGSAHTPNIEVVDVDLEKDRRLELVHEVREGRELYDEGAQKVLQHLSNLWSYPVALYENSDGALKSSLARVPDEDVLKLWHPTR